MKKQQIKEKILRRLVERFLPENQPATTPAKPSEKPGTKEKPGTPEKPKEPRRRVGAPDKKPDVMPAKATTVNEEEMLQKIVKRFKAKKVEEEKSISPVKAQKLKKLSALLNRNTASDNLSGSDLANFNRSLEKPFNPIKKDDIPLDKYLSLKNKK